LIGQRENQEFELLQFVFGEVEGNGLWYDEKLS